MKQPKNIKSAETLNNKMNQLIAVAENYPELKASEQYLNLQKNLTKIESQLQAARRIYNLEVTNYNTKLDVVPSNLIASLFGFEHAQLFEIEDYKDRKINTLSKGNQQKVQFISAIINEPELLILDEPFSALDYQTRLVLSEDVYLSLIHI